MAQHISKEVRDGIIAVAESGKTNMFDRNAAALWAAVLGHKEASAWIMDIRNEEAYVKFIMEGDDE